MLLTTLTSSHLPQGRCGLKFCCRANYIRAFTSPSARKVWIEIYIYCDTDSCKAASPSARKVWIEIFDYDKFASALVSPSARKVWIEICKRCIKMRTMRRHLPQGRCGLKSALEKPKSLDTASPSARKVWIEIYDSKSYVFPVTRHLPQGRCGLKYRKNKT